jgi:hypothetical protein
MDDDEKHMKDDELDEDPGLNDLQLEVFEEDRPAHMIPMLQSFYEESKSNTSENIDIKRMKKRDDRDENQPKITMFLAKNKEKKSI